MQHYLTIKAHRRFYLLVHPQMPECIGAARYFVKGADR